MARRAHLAQRSLALPWRTRAFRPSPMLRRLLWLSVAWRSHRACGMYLLSSSGDFDQGCFQVSVGVHTKDMSATSGAFSCSGQRCPPCFFMDTSSGPVQLTLKNCHVNAFSVLHGLSLLTTFHFTNGGGSAATVQDDAGQVYLMPRIGQHGASMECKCFASVGKGNLVCDSSVTPISYTGDIASFDHLYTDTCMKITVDGQSYNLQFPTCVFKYCPACFLLDTSGGAVTATFTNCGFYFGMDQSSAGVLRYQFSNIGPNIARVSDGTNVYSLSPVGSGESVMSCTCSSSKLICGSTTVRPVADTTGIASFPESLSVTDAVRLGSSLSVRGFTRLGGPVRANGQAVQFGSDANTYAQYTAGSLEFWVDSTKMLSMTSAIGKLHGTWESENTVTTSDSRLKRRIEPLLDTLGRLQAKHAEGRSLDPASWLLERLRPVSFIMLRDEVGGRRFGFLAEDLERVVPDMVRRSDDTMRTRKVYMLDLVAVLVVVAQHHHAVLAALEARSNQTQLALEERIRALEHIVATLAQRVQVCCRVGNSCSGAMA
mmetsp:Transcript_10520/g.29932  ORF Transcript_10520/g.29932 Transcript_10520/m.29932 type:complete len:543 (+) Transcript_10520:67-1695(+)